MSCTIYTKWEDKLRILSQHIYFEREDGLLNLDLDPLQAQTFLLTYTKVLQLPHILVADTHHIDYQGERLKPKHINDFETLMRSNPRDTYILRDIMFHHGMMFINVAYKPNDLKRLAQLRHDKLNRILDET